MGAPRATWLTGGGAMVLLVSLFLPQVEAESYEDFFTTYYESSPPPDLQELPTVNAWFFPVPSAGTLLGILAALAIAIALALRPDLALRLRSAALAIAVLLPAWVLATMVLFPGLDAPPFERLPATWVAMASAIVTAVGLVLFVGSLACRAGRPTLHRRA